MNSTVIGASVGIAGYCIGGTGYMLENATASIGSGTTVTLQDNTSTVTVDALRDVDTAECYSDGRRGNCWKFLMQG